jgi:hypothetical protein
MLSLKKGKVIYLQKKKTVLFHGVEPFDAKVELYLLMERKAGAKVFGKTICDIAENKS